jgi:hypothetical protein
MCGHFFTIYAAECRSRGPVPQSESFILSSTPQFNGEQLAAARKERWHQGGDSLLTLEAAREWVGELGLVLFAPRAQQLAAPAPSLVEATLGRASSAPTAAETEIARSLVARMVAEGMALPLNLLGGPGDVPDFVVSAQVFSYVFTLRGDKAWKQPPATSGSLKVSLLAAKVYETLAQGNALTAAELASELGREVTETAIVRALVELWAQLRVIPLLQQGDAATMWELTSRRFTKLVKAGANAGQPTALSALISLYLAQAYVATEEEVETFLSPLSARSKVRDVLHGLGAARQLENVVLEGKTLFYVPGALPEFPEIAAAEPAKEEGTLQAVTATSEPRERIRRFDRPRPSREERGERTLRGDRERPAKPFGEKRHAGARPAGKSFANRGRPAKPFGEKRSGGARPTGKSFADRGPAKPFGERRSARPEGGSFAGRERPAKPFGEKREGVRREGKSFGDRERRPFQRDRASEERPSFARPWDEERKPRPKREEGERPARERSYRKDDARGAGAKREFRGEARKPGSDRGPRPERAFRPRREGEREGFAPRTSKPFRERSESGGDERKRRPSAPRPSGKPGFAGKPKFGEKRAFGDKPKFGEKKKFGDKRAFGEKPKFGEKRTFGDKPKFGEKKKFGEKRSFGDKPKFGEKKKFGSKPGFAGKPKFGGRSKFGGPAKFGGKPKSGGKPGAKRAPRSGGDKPKREAEE